MPFKISKEYYNTDWNTLGLADENSVRWKEGIAIIKNRFESRFFHQIDKIKDDAFSGFIVMSIDCLLIETLMQFYLGVESSETNYKGRQQEAFRDFFIQSKHFNAIFNTDDISFTFYKQFRCGLLHQAQTKQKSLIKIKQTNLLSFVDGQNVITGLIIDRNLFHEKLVLEFEDYIDGLSTNQTSFKGENLRLKAIDKMALICSE